MLPVAVTRFFSDDTLCTSGFVDDVTFAYNWLYGAYGYEGV